MLYSAGIGSGALVLCISEIACNSLDLLNSMKMDGFLDEVIEYPIHKERSSHLKIPLVFSFKLLELRFGHEDQLAKRLLKYNINKVILFSPNAASIYLRYLFKKADFYFAEDGVGTYTGEIFNRVFYLEENRGRKELKSVHRIAQAINRIMFHSSLNLRIRGIYVHEPKLAVATLPAPLLRIGNEKEFAQYASAYVDAYPEYENKVIFLGQPIEDSRKSEVFKRMSNILDANNIDWVYRKHPRETDTEVKNEISEGSWEEVCLSGSCGDNTLLISVNSSALISPKLLTGAEPKIIYLYKFLPSNPQTDKKMDELIERIRAIYSDKTRVIVPVEWREFEQAIIKK